MNSTGIKAIEDELGRVRDQVRRAEQQQRQLPTWTTGDGVRIDVVIRGYKKTERELLEALAEVRNGNNTAEG